MAVLVAENQVWCIEAAVMACLHVWIGCITALNLFLLVLADWPPAIVHLYVASSG